MFQPKLFKCQVLIPQNSHNRPELSFTVDTPADFEKVKMGLRKLCFKLGVPHYRFQTSPGTTFHEMLKNSLVKLENEYPACGISFDQKFDISNLSFILADNDTF